MAQEFKVGEAPWEQKAGPLEFTAGQAPWEVEGDIIENKMPEGLGMSRAIVKNLAASPEAAFNFLQKEHPDFEFKKDDSGEVLAKKRGDKAWGRLDPKGFDLMDVTDIGADVASGIGQGIATAASGIAGGAATGGVGALPAAMAGGAASGAGLEAIRQSLGSLAGIENNISGKDIAMTGGIGALSPLLLGTGATAQQALTASLKSGTKATQEQILKSQSGLLGKGYDKLAGSIGPKIGTFISGENPEVIKTAAKMLGEIKKADTSPEPFITPLREAAKEINISLKTQARDVGQRMNQLRSQIDNVPGIVQPGKGTGSISSKEFMAPFEELAVKLAAAGAPTAAQKKDLMQLKKVIESEFKGLPENLTTAQVDNLRKRFKTRAQQYGLNYNKSGQAVSATEGASAIDAQIATAFEDARRNMDSSIINKLEEMFPGSGEEYQGLKDSYAMIKGLQKQTAPMTKTSKAFGEFVKRSTKNPADEALLMDLTKQTGLDLPELAFKTQALATFSKPSTTVRSLGGSTSTSRTIPLSTAGGAAGYYLGQKFNMSPFLTAAIMGSLGSTVGSPAALRKYMELNQLGRQLPQVLPGFQAMPYTLMNMAQDPTKGE